MILYGKPVTPTDFIELSVRKAVEKVYHTITHGANKMVVVRPSADPVPVGTIAEFDTIEDVAFHELFYGPENRGPANSAVGGAKTLPEVVGGKRFPGVGKFGQFFNQNTPWAGIGTTEIKKGILNPAEHIYLVIIVFRAVVARQTRM